MTTATYYIDDCPMHCTWVGAPKSAQERGRRELRALSTSDAA